MKPKEQTTPPDPGEVQLPQPSLMEIQEKLGLFDQAEHAQAETQNRLDALEDKPLSFI